MRRAPAPPPTLLLALPASIAGKIPAEPQRRTEPLAAIVDMIDSLGEHVSLWMRSREGEAMRVCRLVAGALSVLMVLLLIPQTARAAQALAITLQPDTGPPGTVIAITGSGAAANADVTLIYGYFGDRNDCLTNQRGRGVNGGTTRADGQGNFAFSHTATASGTSGSIRFLASSAGALPSPWACFAFGNAQQRTFTETGKTIGGDFLTYWNANGGLTQQGYPISDVVNEVSPTDGKNYQVQYFERARFELHPENVAPYNVLLGLLGREQYLAKYPGGRPAGGTGDVCFDQTGRCVRSRFYDYWQSHGGLAQQGLPLSDEFDEVNPTDGKTYRVQYFERARFEYHPENAAPYDVLLGLLGREQLLNKPTGAPPVDTSWGPTLPPLVGGKTYTDPQGRFSVSVPQDWSPQADSSGSTTFQRQSTYVAWMNARTLPSGITLEDLQTSYAETIAQTRGATLLRIDKVFVAGERAYRFVYTNNDDNGQLFLVEYTILVSGGKEHSLSFSTDPSDNAHLSVTFDRVLGSYVIGPAGR